MTSQPVLPSPSLRRVGIRIKTFEACSGFTHVTARRIAQLPKATFVTRLRSGQLPSRTARQLPDPSTLIRVESSSNRDRGEPRGSSPPTPPCVRVRTRRFGRLCGWNAGEARSGERRRALECGVRRFGFGPSGADASGFTHRPLAESQFELDFRPLGQCENSALLALSTVRAFGRYAGLLCPLLTSAPRSHALRRAQSGVPDTARTSRGKFGRLPRTPAGFTTPAFDDHGLRGHTPARPAG